MTDDEMIAAIRAMPSGDDVTPIASASDISDAEARLGFRLITLLRRILGEVANGGTSMGHGLFGIPSGTGAHADDEGRTMLEVRATLTGGGHETRILARAVPLCDLGCAQWLWLDCDGGEDGTLLLMAEGAIYRTDLTLRTGLAAWLAGALNTALFEEGESRTGINPFTKQPMTVRLLRPRGVRVCSLTSEG